jgi:hypothetical protein
MRSGDVALRVSIVFSVVGFITIVRLKELNGGCASTFGGGSAPDNYASRLQS